MTGFCRTSRFDDFGRLRSGLSDVPVAEAENLDESSYSGPTGLCGVIYVIAALVEGSLAGVSSEPFARRSDLDIVDIAHIARMDHQPLFFADARHDAPHAEAALG